MKELRKICQPSIVGEKADIGVVGDRWQDMVIEAHGFVCKARIIMPAGSLHKIL